MRIRVREIVIGTALLVAVIAYLGDGNGDEAASPTVMEAAERLSAYYSETPIREDWEVRKIVAARHDVRVHVRVPSGQAAALVKSPHYFVSAMLGEACPVKSDRVWSIIEPEEDITVNGEMAHDEVFINVSCRLMGH